MLPDSLNKYMTDDIHEQQSIIYYIYEYNMYIDI